MEKESLTHSLDFIDEIFKTFFDFNIIFVPNGDGKVVLNYRYIQEAQIEIANKISFIQTLVDDTLKKQLIFFDISDILIELENPNFNTIDSEQILSLLNKLAIKYKNFNEIQIKIRVENR